MSSFLLDIRRSARSLARSPGRALALLFTIALGIGSNVSIHGFTRGLTTRSSPLTAKDRVISLFARDAHRGSGPVSYEEYSSLKNHVDAFEWVGAARISQVVITLPDRSAIMSTAAVTPDLAHLLDLSIEEGVVISHRAWQDEFGGKANIRGEQLRIGDVDARVVGVAPDWLEGVYNDRVIDLWMPLREKALGKRDGSIRDFWVLAGLRPDVSINQIEDDVRASRTGSGDIYVLPYTGMTPEMAEGVLRVGTLLRVAAAFVFFIACANVASFLLGRAAARSHETSVRVVLGAARGRLARAVLSDSVAISLTGGALGLLFAVWTSRVLPALLFQGDAELLVLAPDVFSLVVASAAGVGIIIACGLVPLFETPHDRPAAVLQRESAGPSRQIRTVRACLVSAQMACCCLLVISTGFLYERLRAAPHTSLSHRLGNPVLATVQAHPDVGDKYFRDVEHAAQAVAGVSAMAWAARIPGSRPAWQSFRIEPQRLPLREVKIDVAAFTSDSLALVALPPKAGRLFALIDHTCQVAVVNEEAAGILFGDDTVGRSVYDPAGVPVEIIGVVAGRKRGFADGRNRPTIYYNYTDQSGPAFDRIALARFRAPVASGLDRAELDAHVVSSNYFAAVGWRLIAGRLFPDDPKARRCRVGVVNQEAADLYFGGNAIGAALIDDTGRRTEIIGVVQSVQLGTFERRAEAAVYFRWRRIAFLG